MTCTFTRWTEAIAVLDLTPATTLAAFQEGFVNRHYLPGSVQFDNHGAFEGLFKAWLRKEGIPFHAIHALHPQPNGKAERPHGPITDKLRASCLGPRTGDWDLFLQPVMLAERTRRNRNIDMSPYQALLGFAPRTPFDTLFNVSPPDLSLADWHTLIENVHAALGTANDLMAHAEKKAFDATRAKPYFFKLGDTPMLLTPSDAPDKLSSPWTAGYLITAVDKAPDFYHVARLELDGTRGTPFEVPVSRLLPFDSTYAPDGGVSLQTKKDHFIVKAINSHDFDPLTFDVTWSDDSTPTAVTIDLVKHCRSMLLAYAQEHNIAWPDILAAAEAEKIQGLPS